MPLQGPKGRPPSLRGNLVDTKLALLHSARPGSPRKILLRDQKGIHILLEGKGKRRRQNTWCRTGHHDFALQAATRPPNNGERAVYESPLPTQPLPTCHSHQRICPHSYKQRRGKGRFLQGTNALMKVVLPHTPTPSKRRAGRLQFESGYRLQHLERRTRTLWRREAKLKRPHVVEFLC